MQISSAGAETVDQGPSSTGKRHYPRLCNPEHRKRRGAIYSFIQFKTPGTDGLLS